VYEGREREREREGEREREIERQREKKKWVFVWHRVKTREGRQMCVGWGGETREWR
jgi:hypothetical protein